MSRTFLSFLVWNSLIATLLFTSFSSLLGKYPFESFFAFIFYQIYFSITLSFISSPSSRSIFEPSYTFLFFAVSFFYAVAFCGSSSAESLFGLKDYRRIRFRGGIVGSVFGFHYIFKHRWVLEFPIIQRSSFFKFKKGIHLAAKSAFKLSIVAIILEVVLLEIIPCPFIDCNIGTEAFFAEQIVVFVSSYVLLFLWEITHTIHQVFYTKRHVFVHPKGSAAANTNPSEHLLSVLEDSNPTSILRYLAYLDLCMVCKNNVDTWRRAAIFEESGETYKRVIVVCLSPLEQLASRLGEDLGKTADKPTNLSNQLSSPTDVMHVAELYDFQPYAWCSRIVASLTACSRKEDKFGVAKLSGGNAAVISTLLSCLLAVENFMGKKTNLQSPTQLLGYAGIKWTAARAKARRLDNATNSKAYAIADVLKTSIYQIVFEFHDEILASTNASVLEKYWITSEKPVFGTREMLIEKLYHFLDC